MAFPLRGRGIVVYWHLERGSVMAHSQAPAYSASEVTAMVQGASAMARP